MRIFIELALALGLLVPVALAQKPPAPPPPAPGPPSPTGPPSTAPTSAPLSSQPIQPRDDLVMFLMGHVATSDGAPVPSDVMVERVCNARVRQQVFATSRGDFNMQLGSRADSFVDASGDGPSLYGAPNRDSEMGIPRNELTNCELRASVPGFHSSIISLVNLHAFDGGDLAAIDVGAIVVQRLAKIQGATVSAAYYKAPEPARRAYEKGLEQVKKGKLEDARKYFEKAVDIYPRFAIAWFQLGTLLQKDNQKDAARTSFAKAAAADTRFLPPFLSLASMAYKEENWPDVLSFTGHILDLDPLNHLTGYVVDLDPLNYTEAYYFNAVANYKLNKLDDAEKSGLKTEHLDLHTRFPRVHLLLAEIAARKSNYAAAIAELRNYLELAPQAKEADQVRVELARLQQLNGSVSVREKPKQN